MTVSNAGMSFGQKSPAKKQVFKLKPIGKIQSENERSIKNLRVG